MGATAPITTSKAPSIDDPQKSRLGRVVASYRQDHRHPVNHFLHVGVGWPIAAVAVILLPFRPLWSVGLILLAYAIMFFGHFVFERNAPTIFTHPTTPFVMAYSVVKGLCSGLVRLAMPSRGR
jgi:hypothetical protein